MTVSRLPNNDGGIQPTILTAKGDLLTATAASTVTNLPVGSNDQVLVADSTTSNGLAWKPYGAPFAAGKNKIINGDFGIWQRGTSFSISSTTVYTADRFYVSSGASGACTATQQAFTAGSAPVAGYESPYFLQVAYGTSGTNAILAEQYIEDVRNFAGQTVTFSFWGRVTSGTFTGATIENVQRFGTGGSGAVVTAQSGTLSFTTSWQRFTATIAVPSISGKTVGAGSSTSMRINIGTSGTSTFQLWGFQAEAGSTATAFQTATGTLQGELAACDRYYEKYSQTANQQNLIGDGIAVALNAVDFSFPCRTAFRVFPTSLDSANIGLFLYRTSTQYSGGTWSIQGGSGSPIIRYTHGSNVFTLGDVVAFITTSASNVGYIGLSAEL